MAKFSIIVPIYNSENYLKRCLNSLINQTFSDIEIILVNDGSTDCSEKIIKEYMNDSRVLYLKKKNGGQASARNLGLKKATGDYVLFVDSDDYVELDICEKLFPFIGTYDIVAFDYFITVDGIDNYYKIFNNNVSCEISTENYLLMDVGPCNKMYNRNYLQSQNFKFPEGIIYEDYAAIPLLVKGGPKVYYLNMALFHYVQDDMSTTRSDVYKQKYEDIFSATEYLYNNLKDCGYDLLLEYLISYHFLYLGSLNFYRFDKFEQINRISEFMMNKFPRWYKNEYVKKMNLKKRFLMRLFYLKKYKLIKFIQTLKRCKNETK